MPYLNKCLILMLQMKRTLSIIFLLVFIYNIAGFFVVFKIEQYAAKDEMKAYISQNPANAELEKIVISNEVMDSRASGFRMFDDNKEFTFNGKLYDIIKSTSDGKFTTFYCLNDKNEERIISNLYEHVQRNTDQNIPSRDNAMKLIKNIIKEALPNEYSSLCNVPFKEIHFTTVFTDLPQNYIPVASPPPKG